MFAHQAGYDAWTGGEEPCVYGFAPGIYDGTKTGLVKELYEGLECVHVVSDVCKTE